MFEKVHHSQIWLHLVNCLALLQPSIMKDPLVSPMPNSPLMEWPLCMLLFWGRRALKLYHYSMCLPPYLISWKQAYPQAWHFCHLAEFKSSKDLGSICPLESNALFIPTFHTQSSSMTHFASEILDHTKLGLKLLFALLIGVFGKYLAFTTLASCAFHEPSSSIIALLRVRCWML